MNLCCINQVSKYGNFLISQKNFCSAHVFFQILDFLGPIQGVTWETLGEMATMTLDIPRNHKYIIALG